MFAKKKKCGLFCEIDYKAYITKTTAIPTTKGIKHIDTSARTRARIRNHK